MDRVKITLDIPINKWNRKLSPIYLMERIFTPANRKNVEVFVKELAVTINKKQNENCDVLNKMWKQASLEYEKLNYPQALNLLTPIIKHARRDSKILADSLRLRGMIFAITGRYEQAIIDTELKIKELSKNDEQQLDELTKIIECYLALGCKQKVIDYFIRFKQIYHKLLNTQAKSLNGIKAKYGHFHVSMEKQLLIMRYQRMLPELRESTKLEPYLGFNKNLKIKNSSISCSLVVKNNKQMIVSNHIIPKGEIVAIESPYLRQQYGTVHCNNCYAAKTNLFPCFECHFKNYCSYDCKIADKRWHDMECIGYKLLILPILKCELLFRLLLHSLAWLKEHTFYRPYMRTAKTAEDLFDYLEKEVNNLPQNILNEDAISYEKFPETEYTKMVLNSFYITIFVSKYTSIFKEHFSTFEANQKQTELFLAALLLKLSAKIVTCSFQINVKMTESQNDLNSNQTSLSEDLPVPKKIESTSGLNIGSDVFKFFGFDREHMKKDATIKVQETIQKHWNTYVPLFESNECEEMLTRYEEADNPVEKWLDVNYFNSDVPSVMGLYLTILKFNHSCDPNLRLIYLSSGTLLVKASRDIQIGEILTISYGCHYKQGDNNTRLMCTNMFNIDCMCDYCNGKFNAYFAENILCISCKSLVNPTEKSCVTCGCDMLKTSYIYKQLICELELNCDGADNDRSVFYHLTFSLMVYEDIMPATNHIFVGRLMLLAHWFAKKNFAYEAYFISIEVQSLMEKIYVEMSPELLYAYNHVLLPLYEILIKYLENPTGIDGSFIEKVYQQTLSIIEAMIEINDFNVLYDAFTCDILKLYRKILNLKVKVYSLFLSGDVYKMIVDSAILLKNPNNIKTLIKSALTKSSNRLLLDECKNELITKLDTSTPNLQNIDSEDTNMKKSVKLTNELETKRIHNNIRKSKTLALLSEYDEYFMKMIEERTGDLDLFLSK